MNGDVRVICWTPLCCCIDLFTYNPFKSI